MDTYFGTEGVRFIVQFGIIFFCTNFFHRPSNSCFCVSLGLEGSDAGLVSVLESMEFCLKLRGSEASVLDELAKAIHLVHIRRDLVESGHSLLNHAYHTQQDYERYTHFTLWACLNENDKTVEKVRKMRKTDGKVYQYGCQI